MERRAYFIFGDLLACIATGAAAGWLAQAAIPAGWTATIGTVPGMAAAMLLGMTLGMLAGVLGGILFSPFFGAMEISLPAGLAGMVAGAVVGMLQAMAGIGAATALWTGAAVGLLCLGYTYLLQARLQGEAK